MPRPAIAVLCFPRETFESEGSVGLALRVETARLRGVRIGGPAGVIGGGGGRSDCITIMIIS